MTQSINNPVKLSPCALEETPLLKHGDIFTIFPDRSAKNWQIVDGRTFVAVPLEYQSSRKVQKAWDKAIQFAEKNRLKRVVLNG